MTVANIFESVTNNNTVRNGGLAGTAQLTTVTNSLAEQILTEVPTNDGLANQVIQSQHDMEVLETIVSDKLTITTVDTDFLKETDSSVLESMLKSQQSKRSRCKSKQMTEDNYKSMLSAAFAESIIRSILGKDKKTGGRRGTGTVEYSDERLEELKADQEQLRKEIRNIQSKKSIMKSKVDFDPNSDRWNSLLIAEEQLKGIRENSTGSTRVVQIDECRETLKEMLAEVDEQKLKAAELKELIESIKQVVFDDVTDDIEETE